jgi:hypothetical protein
MTEAEWLASADPTTMLAFLRGKASDRRLRLFAVAVYRARLGGGARAAQRAAERVAKLAERMAEGGPTGAADRIDGVYFVLFSTGLGAASRLAEHPTVPDHGKCGLLRDIFGNPFRPVTFAPDWRTDTAVSLAQQMYEARKFSAMPILADALQDAGCDNDDILAHCRGEGPHVRGCWVVDLVLGKG